LKYILSVYGPTALCWALAAFSVSWFYTQSVWLLGRGISPAQGHYLQTRQHKHRINAHTDIHVSSGIRTHDPSVWAEDNSSCLRPRGHCDRHRNVVNGFKTICLLKPKTIKLGTFIYQIFNFLNIF
jgi:hypothetical protein